MTTYLERHIIRKRNNGSAKSDLSSPLDAEVVLVPPSPTGGGKGVVQATERSSFKGSAPPGIPDEEELVSMHVGPLTGAVMATIKKRARQLREVFISNVEDMTTGEFLTTLGYEGKSNGKTYAAIAVERMLKATEGVQYADLRSKLLSVRTKLNVDVEMLQLHTRFQSQSNNLVELGIYYATARKFGDHQPGLRSAIAICDTLLQGDSFAVSDSKKSVNHISSFEWGRPLSGIVNSDDPYDINLVGPLHQRFYLYTKTSQLFATWHHEFQEAGEPMPPLSTILSKLITLATLLELSFESDYIGKVSEILDKLQQRKDEFLIRTKALGSTPDGWFRPVSVHFDDKTNVVKRKRLTQPTYKPKMSVSPLDNKSWETFTGATSFADSFHMHDDTSRKIIEVAANNYAGSGDMVGQLTRLNEVYKQHVTNMRNRIIATGGGAEMLERTAACAEKYVIWLGYPLEVEPYDFVKKVCNKRPSEWEDAWASEDGTGSAYPHNGVNKNSGAGFPFHNKKKVEVLVETMAICDSMWELFRNGGKYKDLFFEFPFLALLYLKSKLEVYELRGRNDCDVDKFIENNLTQRKVRTIYNNSFPASYAMQKLKSIGDTMYKAFFTRSLTEDGVSYPGLEQSIIPLKGFNPTGGSIDILLRRVQCQNPFELQSPNPMFVYSDNCFLVGNLSKDYGREVEATADTKFLGIVKSRHEIVAGLAKGTRVFVSVDGAKMESSTTMDDAYIYQNAILGKWGITASNPETKILYEYLMASTMFANAGGYGAFNEHLFWVPYQESGSPSTFDLNDMKSYSVFLEYSETQEYKEGLIDFELMNEVAKRHGVTLTVERITECPEVGISMILPDDDYLDIDLLGFSVGRVYVSGSWFPDEESFSDLGYPLAVPILEDSRAVKSLLFDKRGSKDPVVTKVNTGMKCLSLLFAGCIFRPSLAYTVIERMLQFPNFIAQAKMMDTYIPDVEDDNFELPLHSRAMGTVETLLSKFERVPRGTEEFREKTVEFKNELENYIVQLMMYSDEETMVFDPTKTVTELYVTRTGYKVSSLTEILNDERKAYEVITQGLVANPKTNKEAQDKMKIYDIMCMLRREFMKKPLESTLIVKGTTISSVVFAASALADLGAIATARHLPDSWIKDLARKAIIINPRLSSDWEKASANIHDNRVKMLQITGQVAKMDREARVAKSKAKVFVPEETVSNRMLKLQQATKGVLAVLKVRRLNRDGAEVEELSKKEKRMVTKEKEKAEMRNDSLNNWSIAPFAFGPFVNGTGRPTYDGMTDLMSIKQLRDVLTVSAEALDKEIGGFLLGKFETVTDSLSKYIKRLSSENVNEKMSGWLVPGVSHGLVTVDLIRNLQVAPGSGILLWNDPTSVTAHDRRSLVAINNFAGSLKIRPHVLLVLLIEPFSLGYQLEQPDLESIMRPDQANVTSRASYSMGSSLKVESTNSFRAEVKALAQTVGRGEDKLDDAACNVVGVALFTIHKWSLQSRFLYGIPVIDETQSVLLSTHKSRGAMIPSDFVQFANFTCLKFSGK